MAADLRAIFQKQAINNAVRASHVDVVMGKVVETVETGGGDDREADEPGDDGSESEPEGSPVFSWESMVGITSHGMSDPVCVCQRERSTIACS